MDTSAYQSLKSGIPSSLASTQYEREARPRCPSRWEKTHSDSTVMVTEMSRMLPQNPYRYFQAQPTQVSSPVRTTVKPISELTKCSPKTNLRCRQHKEMSADRREGMSLGKLLGVACGDRKHGGIEKTVDDGNLYHKVPTSETKSRRMGSKTYIVFHRNFCSRHAVDMPVVTAVSDPASHQAKPAISTLVVQDLQRAVRCQTPPGL